VDARIRSLKKVELHRHFEGCVTPKIFHNLIKKNSPDSVYNELSAIESLYAFSDFVGFLDAFGTVVNQIRDYDDFGILTKAISNSLSEENIKYTEFLFSPEPFIKMGLDTRTILRTIMETFESSRSQTGMVIDLVRQAGYDSMMNCLKEIIYIRKNDTELHNWIKGISIGGNELDNPGKWFVDHFNLAKKNGLHLAAHAGEWDNQQSVWDALNLLNVERVGHGITSVAENKLVSELKNRGITIDISITSNYFTGVAEKGNHPVKSLFRNECKVTLNTDDPGFFGTDLNQEYAKFIDLGFEFKDLKIIIENSVQGSFLSVEEKSELQNDVL
jgi:adenosine deaminase